MGATTTQYPIKVTYASDADPIYDHANGVKVSVNTTSTNVLVPPSLCKYVRISSDADVFVRTDANTAADDGKSIRLIANSPEVIPVTANVLITAIASTGTATVRCTPLKARP